MDVCPIIVDVVYHLPESKSTYKRGSLVTMYLARLEVKERDDDAIRGIYSVPE